MADANLNILKELQRFMTSARLAAIFHAVDQRLAHKAVDMVGKAIGEIRFAVLKDLMRAFHAGVDIVTPSNPDRVEDQIAIAMCALGPTQWGPPDSSLFKTVHRNVNIPALDHHNQRAVALLHEVNAAKPGRGLSDEAEAFQEDAGCWQNPAVHTVVWWGLAGDGRVPEPGWTELWLAAKWWLMQQAGLACGYFDRALISWDHANLQPHLGDGGIAPTAPAELVSAMTRQLTPAYPVPPGDRLTFVFRPTPTSELPIAVLLDTPGYEKQWEDAGLSVFIGSRVIARRRPETRFVFWTDRYGFETEGRQKLAAGSRVVASCGDRRLDVTGDPGCRGEPKLSTDLFIQEFVSKGSGLVREAHCHCGTQSCETRHHVTAWYPLESPYIGLENFVWNAVKGPMAATPGGDVLRYAQKSLRTGMYYPVLAEGMHTVTPHRVRSVEARLYVCGNCGKKGYEQGTIMHDPGCPNDALSQKSDGRFVHFSMAHWALRPFYETPEPEGLYHLTDQQVVDHAWFARFVRLSAPNWGALTQAGKNDWYGTLSASNSLVSLVPAHYIDICRLAPSPERRMAFLRKTAHRRAAYARLLADAEQARGAPPPDDDERWWDFILDYGCAHSPWYYLLLRGLPAQLKFAPLLSRYEQLVLIYREGDTAKWPGNVFCPGPPRHLWAKD